MFRMVSVDELQRMLERPSGCVLLDVLAPESYQNRHIPGARHADVHGPDFEERVQRIVPDKRTPVIVYCGNMNCTASTKAAQRLHELGYQDVREFKAGLEGWKQAGLDFERPSQRMRRSRRKSHARPAARVVPKGR